MKDALWLSNAGSHSDVVVSTRIRFARNIKNTFFSNRLDSAIAKKLLNQIHDALVSITHKEFTWIDLQDIQPLTRQALFERHLISRELIERERPSALAVNENETLALMVNEEDHIRLQSFAPGFNVDEAFKSLDMMDSKLAQVLEYAFDPVLGFLTACPTNVGTGLRVSAMLHLPAMVITKELNKLFRAMQDLRMTVRGLHGEGTEVLGNLFQISNQATLGRSEPEIIEQLRSVVNAVCDYEQKARKRLLETQRIRLEDTVYRAHAMIQTARVLTTQEAMELLSRVRLGIALGWIPSVSYEKINTLFVQCQPAHIQIRANKRLEVDERDEFRAAFLRQMFIL